MQQFTVLSYLTYPGQNAYARFRAYSWFHSFKCHQSQTDCDTYTRYIGNVAVGTVELHLYMIFPMTILICYLIIITAIFPYLINCFLKNKLKWSNNANNACVCDYIAWKVHISIITVW